MKRLEMFDKFWEMYKVLGEEFNRESIEKMMEIMDVDVVKNNDKIYELLNDMNMRGMKLGAHIGLFFQDEIRKSLSGNKDGK